jgi:hypothetical protein
MPKLDGLGTVVDFLNDLTTPKIAAQIAKKVLGLAVAPCRRTADSCTVT